MANTIIRLKESGVPGNVPSTLAPGELAINHADGKLYFGNTTSQVKLFDAITEPVGLDSEIQFNNSGTFGSDADFRYLTSNNTLLVQTIALSGVNVGSTLSSSYNQANTATTAAAAAQAKADAGYNQANTATLLASSANDFAISMAIALG